MEFKEIVEKRYATKKFNGEKISEEKIDELLEIIRLAPSSFGLQPWKVKIIEDQETKDKLLEASWNQEQVTTCSHLLVFCAIKDIRKQIDKYEEMMRKTGMPEDALSQYVGMMRGFDESMKEEDKLIWAQKQLYIAMENALLGAKALGFDSCPMEGFMPEKYSEILKLPEGLVPSLVVPVGYAADEAKPKIRYSKEEMFF